MEQVAIDALDPERFERVLDADRYRRFSQGMARAAECFGGRTLWCVNSTANGGGVAEMIRPLLGYLLGGGSTPGGSSSTATTTSS